MAGAFSGHLVQSHEQQSTICTSGAMSFNPTMHGSTPSFFASQTPGISMSMPFTPNPFANTNGSLSEETAQRIAQLQAKLTQKLGPEYVSQRPGPAGKLTYAEGWKIINLANEVFGFNGWSSNVVNLTTDFIEKNDSSGRYNVGVTAIIRVTLRDGVYHEDIGYGMLENSKSQGQALDKCKKEAVTDGLKRALRNFGNLMGNCLYDKAYAQEIVKMKVPPAKFDKSELHRRKEFVEPEEIKPTIPPQPANNNNSRPSVPPFNASNTSSTSSTTARQPQSNTNASTSHVPQNSTTNMRSSINSNPNTSMNNANISISKPSGSTTSVPNQNARSNQPQPPQNRHVSFAQSSSSTSISAHTIRTETPVAQTKCTTLKAEQEDSFDFGDDDAFFAALDMGEADLGRPLETETDTDLGQPIAFDETFDTTRGGDRSSVINDSLSMANISVEEKDKSKDQAAINKAARLQRLQQQIRSASLTMDDEEDQQSILPDELTMNKASLGSNSNSNSSLNNSRPFQMSTIGQRQVTSSSNMNMQRNQNQNQNQNQRQQPMKLSPVQDRDQNRNPNTTPSNSNDKSNGKKPLTPSMGGFHFPPGMNPLQTQNLNANGTLNRSNGIKRTADAMTCSDGITAPGSGLGLGFGSGTGTGNSNGSGNGYRGSRPGMGLQQGAPPIIRREPFAPLEVGEGGDVKRIRR